MLEFRFNGLKPVANVIICLVLFFHLLRAKALRTGIYKTITTFCIAKKSVHAQITTMSYQSVIRLNYFSAKAMKTEN